MRVLFIVIAAIISVSLALLGGISGIHPAIAAGSLVTTEILTASAMLASIPGVTVTQWWHNLDVTLEEFGFDFTVTGQPVRLYFGETDSIRSMRRKAAVAALQARIAREIVLTQTNK